MEIKMKNEVVGGKIVQPVESTDDSTYDDCDNCCFNGYDCAAEAIGEDAKCLAGDRSDGKNVYFIEVV